MLQRMISLKDGVLNDIDKTIESTGALVAARAAKELGDFMTEIEPFTEGVQWDGVLRVWHYAHNLRQVVFRLATIRIRRCQDFAREQALACVSNIERMASNAMPEPPRISTDAIVAAFDQSQAVSSTPEDLALQMADLFDVSDKLDILKDYLPSLALMAGGLLGYRGFTAGLLRMAQTASYARMSKLAFAGLGLAGVGAFLYVLSDMKSGIQRKLTRKMKEHFSQTGFVTKTPEALGITSRRVLRSTIWDFQNQFQRVLAEREETIGVQYKAKLEAEQARAFFENVSRRATLLHDQLEEVELDA
ncbi:hypothetical protein BC831DRAFT_447369 [Entophlyctis helioformis]|nr:hypothetical protein BC831DRAFT_447369 [Entophlyctis helioformis]